MASDELGAPAGLRLSDGEIDDVALALAAEGPLTNAALRARLNVDRLEALRVLSRLSKTGQLVRRGERRGTYYTLPEDHRA